MLGIKNTMIRKLYKNLYSHCNRDRRKKERSSLGKIKAWSRRQHPETEEKNLEREQCHGSQTAKSRGKEDWAMSELLTVE